MATYSFSSSPAKAMPEPPSPSDGDVLRSLVRLSREISLSDRPAGGALLRRAFASAARKSKILALLFEDLLLRSGDAAGAGALPRSAFLCLREILLVLQRFKALLADLASRSRMRLLLQAEAVANDFRELTIELSTLLDILPIPDLGLADDVRDLVDLLRRQCRSATAAVDPAEASLRREILDLIREIEREIVPDRARLEAIFQRLGLDDSRSCKTEIDCLEREIGDRSCEKWAAAMVALVGLVRYAKCVLFGASTPRSETSADGGGKLAFFSSPAAAADFAVPADFRCPISLELMRDPVVVASGQTYDRESIARWIASGHATCPKTGQALVHLDLVPNRALKSLISQWCRKENVPFDKSQEAGAGSGGDANAVAANKAALEAARMTASFLVERLATSPSPDAANRVVHELRQLAKSGSDNRAFVAEAGAIPLLLPLLRSDDASLQVNAVTALLNLSILEANKKRIMHADGAVDDVVHVMADGASWRARENAAATVVSLCSVHAYRRRLGRNPRVIAELVRLVEEGPVSTKKDALAAILSLAGDRENIGRLIESGALPATLAAMEVTEVAEEAVAVVAAVAKRGGAEAVAGAVGAIQKLVRVLRRGSDRGRESAAAALVLLCRHAGEAPVAELAAMPGIEWVIWELMGSGTERAKRKAAALGRICRRWAAAAVEAQRTAGLPVMSITAVQS